MIGGGLIRFHPHQQQQDGKGLPFEWKDLKKRAPAIACDVLTASLTEGLKGLNSRTKSGKVNWKGGLEGVKKGALKAIKRKAAQEAVRLTAKKARKDIFGLRFQSIQDAWIDFHPPFYGGWRRRRMYKGGQFLPGLSNLPSSQWVQKAVSKRGGRRRRRRRRRKKRRR